MSAPARSHAVFDSKIGSLAVAWSERGLVGVQLPEATRAKTAKRLAARAGSVEAVAPAWVQRAVEQMRALVAGAPADLDDVRLDAASVPEFHGRVYTALRFGLGRYNVEAQVDAAVAAVAEAVEAVRSRSAPLPR